MRGSPGNQFLSALAVVLILACEPQGKPKPVDIADFDSDSAMTDTLRRLVPVGTPVATARSLMEASGLVCDQRSETVKPDTMSGALGAGAPVLVCFGSKRFFPWVQHRDWSMRYSYDSTGVTGVLAGYIIQP